jgi:hypothetical protein
MTLAASNPKRFAQANAANLTPTNVTQWRDKLGISGETGWFNVTDYGAVGDGVTNDRAAIQNAVDACISFGGGTVYFPTGTYLVSGKNEFDIQLTIGSFSIADTTINLVGSDAIITTPATGDSSPDSTSLIQIAGPIVNSVVSGIHFRANGTNVTDFETYGFFMQGGGANAIKNFTFRECVFENFRRGIQASGVNGLTVSGCRFITSMARQDILAQSPFVGIWCFVNAFGQTSNVNVVGNIYDGFTGSDINGKIAGDGFVYGLSRGWVVANNTILRPRAEGIYVNSRGGYELTSYPISITGNTILATLGSGEADNFTVGIRVDDSNATIGNNSLVDVVTGIFVGDGTNALRNIAIGDNSISLRNFNTTGEQDGIFVNLASEVSICGNVVVLPSSNTGTGTIKGIYLAQTTRATVSNNYVRAVTKPTTRSMIGFRSTNGSDASIVDFTADNLNVGIDMQDTDVLRFSRLRTPNCTSRRTGVPSLTQNVDAVGGQPGIRGDESATLTIGASEPEQVWDSSLSTTRDVTLSNAGFIQGDRWRISRPGGGASPLNVYQSDGVTLIKALAQNQFVEVVVFGGLWRSVSSGSI